MGTTRLALLLGAPLLAIAVLLAWFVGSDPSGRPEPIRNAGPGEVPEAGRTAVARYFAGELTGASAPSRAVANGRAFNLEVADDAASRALGLGGRDALADDAGMLFVFPVDGFHRFWMKDVSFPLDLLYITGDGMIVDIRRMEPEPGVPDADLTIYGPPVEVLLALEINGGLAQQHGIEAGMAVRFE